MEGLRIIMYNLIIVEDEKIIRSSLQDYIRQTCREFSVGGTFSNGKDALAYCETHHTDVVLTDIKMDKMDGLTLCSLLHQQYPFCHMIIISGFGTFDYARKALQYGVKNYLLKPIDFKELTDCLSSIKASLDRETALIDAAEEDASLFFTELVSGSLSSPKAIADHLANLNPDLPFLNPESSGCILRLSLTPANHAASWRYEKDRLPLIFTNLLRMHLADIYVNNFLSVGTYSYYILLFKSVEVPVCPQELMDKIRELFHLHVQIDEICRFSNLLQLSMQKLLGNLAPWHDRNVTDENATIEKIKSYIQENYDKDISRQELADLFYFSSAYFSRFFKKKTGQNFIDYLTTVRMEKAIELLATRMSVDEIARKTGYNSRNHFILNFRQYTSLSPTEYRRQVLKQ